MLLELSVTVVFVAQCCPGYVATDMSSYKGTKTIDQGLFSFITLSKLVMYLTDICFCTFASVIHPPVLQAVCSLDKSSSHTKYTRNT